jgi:hypothetical protein
VVHPWSDHCVDRNRDRIRRGARAKALAATPAAQEYSRAISDGLELTSFAAGVTKESPHTLRDARQVAAPTQNQAHPDTDRTKQDADAG